MTKQRRQAIRESAFVRENSEQCNYTVLVVIVAATAITAALGCFIAYFVQQ